MLEGLEAVQESGRRVNMLDLKAVLAHGYGHPETADRIQNAENHGAYMQGVLHGFEAEGD